MTEWHIRRVSPTIEVPYRGERFDFTYFNTDLYYFTQSEEVSHIFHQPRERFLYMFNCSKMMERLITEGFPYHVAPWPSEQDLEAFVQSEMTELS
jgi:hypothetical protein